MEILKQHWQAGYKFDSILAGAGATVGVGVSLASHCAPLRTAREPLIITTPG